MSYSNCILCFVRSKAQSMSSLLMLVTLWHSRWTFNLQFINKKNKFTNTQQKNLWDTVNYKMETLELVPKCHLSKITILKRVYPFAAGNFPEKHLLKLDKEFPSHHLAKKNKNCQKYTYTVKHFQSSLPDAKNQLPKNGHVQRAKIWDTVIPGYSNGHP